MRNRYLSLVLFGITAIPLGAQSLTRINRQRVLAIVHRIDRSVHIVGAGQPFSNGKNELPALLLG
jgi:hypothetical protein